VLGRRTPEGGYCFYRTPEWGVEEPNASDTLAALEALRILGVAPPEPEVTGRWLQALQDEDGGYPSLRIGWAALRAIALLGMQPAHPPTKWVAHRAKLLLRGNGPRDWRGALGNALHLVELLSLTSSNPDTEERRALTRLLDRSSDPNGGWTRPGADLEATAVALRLVRLARLSRHVEPNVAEYLRRCEDGVLGLRLTPNTVSTSVGALWGGLYIAHALGLYLSYPGEIRKSLMLLQRPDGGLGTRHRAITHLQDTWLGLEAACMLDDLEAKRK
jgi:hypothetical protein